MENSFFKIKKPNLGGGSAGSCVWEIYFCAPTPPSRTFQNRAHILWATDFDLSEIELEEICVIALYGKRI